MWLSRTWKLSIQPREIGKSLKRFAGDSRCETSSGKAHTGLSKLPFCQVKVKPFSECVTDRLILCFYNFAHFLVAIVKLPATIALVWYRAARAQLLVPVLNVPEPKVFVLLIASYWSITDSVMLHIVRGRDRGHRWLSLCSRVSLLWICKRRHFISLKHSFQSWLQDDRRSRSSCKWSMSAGIDWIGWRHLVSSAKRKTLEYINVLLKGMSLS